MTSTKKTEKIAASSDEQNIIIALNAPETLPLKDIQEEIENHFQSIDEFKAFVFNKFINGSGIAPELFAECVEFYSEEEFDTWGDSRHPIHELLNWAEVGKREWTNWKGESRSEYRKQPLFAAILKNEDGTVWQGIVSAYDSEKNRPYKYLAPTANGDRLYLPPIPKTIRQKIGGRYGVQVPLDGSFWEWLELAKLPKILSEGGKKSLSLLTQGYVGISMYGCSCGGKESPTPDLTRFNQDGSTWLFALDRDEKLSTKRKVNSSKKRLADNLSTQSVTCIEDIVWKTEDGKGVDDLIVNKGSGAFDVAYGLAVGRVNKQSASGGYDDSIGEKKKTPIQSEIAALLAKKFKNTLAFNNERERWMCYSIDTIGVWTEEKNPVVDALIYKTLLQEGFDCFSSSFVGGVVSLLKNELFVRKWEEPEAFDYLPFEDGILEIATGQMLPHDPKYRLTWQLPRKYEHDGNWETINQFLDEATCGRQDMKQTLLCYCNAVLKGRYKLQKFLYLIGLPGSGKGTFIRLLTSLIGIKNTINTDMKTWNNINFEQSRAYRKRLVLFPEQTPYADDVSKFLSLTGEDNLRLEKKGKDAADDFPFTGLVLLAGNFPVFSGTALNAIKRRAIMLRFDNVVTGEKKDFSELFKPELSAFTAHCLSIPDEVVKRVLEGKPSAESAVEVWEERMRTDPLAHWANYHVVADPMAITFMGNNANECADGRAATTFYGSYANFCNRANNRALAINNFSPNFKDLLRTVWDWCIDEKSSNKGRSLMGVRLRVDGFDDHIPSYDMVLKNQAKPKSDVGSDGVSDGLSDGIEPLHCEEYSESDGLSAKTAPNIETNFVFDQNQPNLPVSSTEVVQPAIETSEQIEYYPPEVNAEVIRACIADGSWDEIEALATYCTKTWGEEYRLQLWQCFTEEEKQALKSLKPQEPAMGYFPDRIPLIKEKSTYWSKSQGRKVTVLFYAHLDPEVSCRIDGRSGTYSLKFDDLACCLGSPVSDFCPGDKVRILEGKQKNQIAKITTIDGQAIYLKSSTTGKSLRVQFYAHQLEKI